LDGCVYHDFLSLLTNFVFWSHLQAEDASLHRDQEVHTVAGVYGGQPFSVIEEFNFWRSKPELAEAVAAIKALTAVIKRSEASTMMGLEIELRNASDALKVSLIPQLAFHMFLFVSSV
jgi:hypothetical protein